MRIKILVIFFLIISSDFVHSQNNDSLKAKSFNINYTLCDYFSTIYVNTICLNIGSEIYLKNKESISINIGYLISTRPSGGLFAVSSNSSHGLKFQIEGKHYLGRHKLFEPAAMIIWPQVFQYKSQTYLNSGYYLSVKSSFQWTNTNRGTNPNPNVYTVDRIVARLNCIIGYECIKKYGLTVDSGIGLGVKYISSDSKNKTISENGWPGNEKEFIWNKLFDDGKGFFPDFVYQLRIGYSF